MYGHVKGSTRTSSRCSHCDHLRTAHLLPSGRCLLCTCTAWVARVRIYRNPLTAWDTDYSAKRRRNPARAFWGVSANGVP